MMGIHAWHWMQITMFMHGEITLWAIGRWNLCTINHNPLLVATNVIDIFAGENFSYILKADNTLWATGKSGYEYIQ